MRIWGELKFFLQDFSPLDQADCITDSLLWRLKRFRVTGCLMQKSVLDIITKITHKSKCIARIWSLEPVVKCKAGVPEQRRNILV